MLLFGALALTAALYLNALQGGFVWDDHGLIGRSQQVLSLDPLVHLGSPFWDEAAAQRADPIYYRPLTTWTFALDRAWGGGGPAAFHTTNVLLHLLATALVFWLARRCGASPAAAGLCAALFGALPRLTESVAWISGRTDLLAGACALGALLAHGQGGARPRHALPAAALLLLGLLAKEVAVAAFAGILAIELTAAARRERSPRVAFLALVPGTLACALYAALRLHALARAPRLEYGTVRHAALMPLQALGQYALMVLDPRPQLQIGILGELQAVPLALGAAVGLVLSAGLVRAARRPPPPGTAAVVACAACALLPVLHVVPIRVAVVAADRFLYLPLACLAVLLATRAARFGPRARRFMLLGSVAALGIYAPLTVARNEDWGDEVRLWRVAVNTTDPRNGLPAHELGNALMAAGRLDEALAAYRQALPWAVGRNELGLRGNIANTLSLLGRLEEARQEFSKLVAVEPDVAAHRYNLALVELRMLQLDEAESELDRALQLMPGYPAALRWKADLPEIRSMLTSLPPERPEESGEVRAARARLWTRLELPPRAVPLWLEVVQNPRSSPAAVAEGAAYLVVHADRDTAALAVAGARRAGMSPGTVAELEAVRADRFPAEEAR